MKWFWVGLAALYLVLAIMSWTASAAYNDRVEHAPNIWVDQEGTLHFFGSPGPGQVSTADLFRDLANYLTQVTRITSVGFIIAALAAVAAFCERRSSRPEAGGEAAPPPS